MKRRHQVNHDLLLPGLPRRKKSLAVWGTSVIAALGLTGAIAIPLVAQPEDRKADAPIAIDALSDPALGNAPVHVSQDAVLGALNASGLDLAIDGRPLGMVSGASTASEEAEEDDATALLAGSVGELGKLPGDLQLMHPVTTRRISSPYGWRSNPTGPGNQIHIGQDYPIACGSPVYASEAGTVTVAGWAGHSGNRVTIDHGSNVQTGYSHNTSLLVKVGDHVEQGQQIAKAGTTGNSTGCHVHFEVIIDGRWNDPRNFLPVIPGQAPAMIDSTRLTVNAGSAPRGSGGQPPVQDGNRSTDPDTVVPVDDTPVVPKPRPTKTAKPTPTEHTGSPSPSDSTGPSSSGSPSAPESTEGSQPPSSTPENSASPTGPSEEHSQSPSGSHEGSDGSTPPGDSNSPSAPGTPDAPSTPNEPSAPESGSKTPSQSPAKTTPPQTQSPAPNPSGSGSPAQNPSGSNSPSASE